MIDCVSARDNNAFITLKFSERTLLNSILKAFIYGIKDLTVQKEAA